MVQNKNIPHFNLYGENGTLNEMAFVHVETIAARNQFHNWEIDPHRHDSLWQLVLLNSGYLNTFIDDKTQKYYGPAIFWLPPTIVHGFNPLPGSIGYVLSIVDSFYDAVVSDDIKSNFVQLSQPLGLVLPSNESRTNEIQKLLEDIYKEFGQRKPGREALIGAKVNALLVHLGRASNALKTEKLAKRDQQFERFKLFVEHHYVEHWQINDYAAQLGMTESKLYALCKKITDQTPTKIIQQRLLIEAKRNLVYTVKPINVVAYELGFQDPAYFSRFFSNQAGISARDFRLKHQKT
ncbi:helix-turn-helix domain-containing protein [Paraglaciecola chathamensis]|uniref:AraC family transcriptional regulator n=1 Tax=Paraglaciecola chathamensis TaxID=368405 RepID=A0A8H9IDB4_9ALTE|nr:helix-turn-helix domain-containing protein [Paraglaciecola oceanifecundans]GGZ79214.1 AraC family transcriptional regulator [Paraglaciecola oceanifecundans]